ncbi:TIGR04024 family LLM class F420-dependent oxidoreductase [Halocatena halophila]|uniref:TIGR04024 family LLM class F420-dependent oxidoreductase n=1 Tax=Halocatena halophila TaxID=2814576 RepID=UPI002ECFD92B
MTALDVSLPVASQPSIEVLSGQAEQAESLGYDRLWLPETWGRDVVTVLSAIAERTTEIGIGSSIAPVYSRSPTLLGQTAATLEELSDGRFRLGVGPSGPQVVEHWHGSSFDRPLRYTRETIAVIKAVLSGEPVEYDGEFFELSGFRLRCDPPTPAPPVDTAGMGPKAVELAGRFADGWHALMLTPDGMRSRLDAFRHGVELGDRDRSNQRVTLSVPCCVDPDLEQARAVVRSHLAFYIGGMGTFYRDALSSQGHEDVASTVYERYNDGDREGAIKAIPTSLLENLAVATTPAQATDALARFRTIDGVDAVAISFPRGATQTQISTTIEELAP